MVRILQSIMSTAAVTFLTTTTSYAVAAERPRPSPEHPFTVTQEADRTGNEETWREGTLLVGFKPGVSAASARQLHAALGSETIRDFRDLRLHLVRLQEELTVEEAIRRYRADSRVAYAEPDYRVSIQVTPDDPRFNELWGLHNVGQTGGVNDADIDGPEAWNLSTGGLSVIVAVLDTGIDTTHPDLLENLWVNAGEVADNGLDDDGNGYIDDVHGIDAILDSGNPWDDHGHGTHVAGTIGAAGNNGTGVAGVNWNVRIMSCKFLDAYGGGYTSDAVECLQYVNLMRGRGADIVATNNSWGGSGYSQALAEAIDAQREILFVAAAGNDGRSDDYMEFYPASYELPNVVAVAASNHVDALAGFSNFGRSTVQIAAPGEAILSTLPATNYWGISGGYGYLSGTSMATPHVTGVAALLRGAITIRDWRVVRNLLLSGGDPLAAFDALTITGRRLNASGSVNCSSRHLIRVVRPPVTVDVGTPVTLKVLSITCGSSTGPVTVTTSQSEMFSLLDDGVAPDAAAGDGVFTGSWTPLRSPEKLDVSSPAGVATVRVPPPYIGHYLADGSMRVFYSQHLSATAAQAPTTWSVVSGSLPPGLGLTVATGEISGQPTATGTYTFTVQLSDAWGLNMTRALSIRVGDGEIMEDLARSMHEGGGADGRAIEVDPSGNVFVVGNLGALGTWTGSGWSGLGKNYLAKYDPSGSLVWLKRYSHGFLRALAVDGSGAIYAAGGTAIWDSGDTLLVKFDPLGNEVWTRTYDNGLHTDVAMDVAISPGGDVLLGGVSESDTVNTMYVQKLDAAGSPLWFQSYSNGAADYGYAVDVDGLGNAYLGGSSATLVPDPYGGYGAHYDFLIRKYDPSGALVWSRPHDSGSRFDFLSDLGVAAGGDVVALGNADEAGYNGFITMKFNGAGDFLWVSTYRSTSHQPAALAVDTQGGVYSTGGSWNEAGSGDWDFLTLKYDRCGILVWKKDTDGRNHLSGYDGDYASGVDVDASGRVYVTGSSYNGIDGYDMLMVRYSAFSGPGEASSGQDMTAERGSEPEQITVDYDAGCGAADHVIVWGTSPMFLDVSWTGIACSCGNSGSTSFNPGPVPPGAFVYFVVVGQDARNEGSYGRDSAGRERNEAVGLGSCDRPRYLETCHTP